MQLPAQLKSALDKILQTTNTSNLEKASSRLTKRYRDEVVDGKMHIDNKNAALGYVAARFPATYAAVFSALQQVQNILPSFSPSSQLDVGAGPGTAVFAAAKLFPALKNATLVEQSSDIIAIGKALFSKCSTMPAACPDLFCEEGGSFEKGEGEKAGEASKRKIISNWQQADILSFVPDTLPHADLVTASYLLDELDEKNRTALVDRLWGKTGGILLLVEPGTPAGFKRLNAARDRLISVGAHIVAPCPHELACPIVPPDWCHFSVRVERSRTHRLAKQAVVPFEDEKFCYLALSHNKPDVQYCRILSRPLRSSGKISCYLCTPAGRKEAATSTRKDKKNYAVMRRSDWGDSLKI